MTSPQTTTGPTTGSGKDDGGDKDKPTRGTFSWEKEKDKEAGEDSGSGSEKSLDLPPVAFGTELPRFADWYSTAKKTATLKEAVTEYFRSVVTYRQQARASAKTAHHLYLAEQLLRIEKRIKLIIDDCLVIGKFEPFADMLAQEFDLFASMARAASGYRPVVGMPEMAEMGERDAINHVLARSRQQVLHLSDGVTTGTAKSLFGTDVTGTLTAPSGFSFAPPAKAIAMATALKKPVRHRGLPTLVLPLNALPPQMIAVIIEVLGTPNVVGQCFTTGGERNVTPDEALGLRSFHQNELGLLPMPAKSESDRSFAYDQLWQLEGGTKLQGKQKQKEVELVPTGLWEFNALGFNDTNVRLVFDSTRDRFYLTFHYQAICVRSTTGGPVCSELASNAAMLTALETPRPGDDTAWVSSMVMLEVPDLFRLTPQMVLSGEGKTKEKLFLVSGGDKRKPTGKEFPLMPVSVKYTKGSPRVSIGVEMLKAAAKSAGLPIGPGSDSNILVIEKLKTSMFDLHLSCVINGESADNFHLAIRTDRHGAVLYWWYRLAWKNAPKGGKQAKDEEFGDPELEWQLDGDINGHGAARYLEMWDALQIYGSAIDGASVLGDMLVALQKTPTKIVVVKKSVAKQGTAEVFYHLRRA